MTLKYEGDPPAWMAELLEEVWTWSNLPKNLMPSIQISPRRKNQRGTFNWSEWKDTSPGSRPGKLFIVINAGSADIESPDALYLFSDMSIRNAVLHEAAHGVNFIHAVRPRRCKCGVQCKVRDRHNYQFKAILGDIEHEFQTGTHSRWGLAGCRQLKRVPNGIPWSDDIPCPR